MLYNSISFNINQLNIINDIFQVEIVGTLYYKFRRIVFNIEYKF